MGRRGPTPTPSAILKARGSWRGGANKAEPQPDNAAPGCPSYLSDAAREVWAQVSESLSRMGVLTRADGNALARYCDALVRWKVAAAFLTLKGDVYTLNDEAGKPKCVQQWPQVAIYHRLSALLLRMEAEFGLTPSSRSRIQVPPSEETQPHTKSRFFPAGPAFRAG